MKRWYGRMVEDMGVQAGGQGCRFVVGVSEEDDGSGVRSSGVEQEVGKRGIGVWRENRLVNSVFLPLLNETALDFSGLCHASLF
nr:hypothetical protein [Tanacetum cinerariifolium]